MQSHPFFPHAALTVADIFIHRPEQFCAKMNIKIGTIVTRHKIRKTIPTATPTPDRYMLKFENPIAEKPTSTVKELKNTVRPPLRNVWITASFTVSKFGSSSLKR